MASTFQRDSDRKRVLILGAAGRDFHNFNTVYRNDPDYEVIAFTAAQIPGIDHKTYPSSLAGAMYPHGIPIRPQAEWEELAAEYAVNEVVFAYSDVTHEHVMHIASRALALGADFRLLGPQSTMLRSIKPVVSICAVRTGVGKSPMARFVAAQLRARGLKVAVVRHPMPYGDLAKQAVQRFATMQDLDAADCTIEEREEYEPHIVAGDLVFAGVDYGRILALAETEADVIIWDGGNNDFPFYQPDLEIVLADPHRAGHETAYFPGEVNVDRAQVIVITKVDTADPAIVQLLGHNLERANPDAIIIETAMPLSADHPEAVGGKRVLVIEDGPTLTHGGMETGAGFLLAHRLEAAEIIDPRPYAAGSIAETFHAFPLLGPVLPAMGYNANQLADLEATIRNTPCDVVLVASPVNLAKLIEINKPVVRVSYEVAELGKPRLSDILTDFVDTNFARIANPASATA